jgi:hypothetical protein
MLVGVKTSLQCKPCTSATSVSDLEAFRQKKLYFDLIVFLFLDVRSDWSLRRPFIAPSPSVKNLSPLTVVI